MALKKLKFKDLKRICASDVFPFQTTEDYDLEHEPLHQERAVGAIDFGLQVKSSGYNIFVSGATGTGRNTQVKKLVYDIAASEKTPDDWIYVYNFSHEDEPIAINLPAGTGRLFKKDMQEMLKELGQAISRGFESEDYEKRKHELLKTYARKRDIVLQEIEDKAKKEGFALKQTATGVILVPKKAGKIMPSKEFMALPQKEKDKIENKKNELHVEIEQVLSEVRTLEKQAKHNIANLEKEIALFSVKHIIDEHRHKYRAFSDIVRYLNMVQEDILEHMDAFRTDEPEPAVIGLPKGPSKKDHLKRYEVNLLVDHTFSEGAPVIIEEKPTYYNLLGRIEYQAQYGAMTTDFTMIAPGAFHKANGGYLILQAMDVLNAFMAWDALKKVIKNETIKVEDINEEYKLVTTTSLKPRPIECKLKIIIIGPPWLYQMLYNLDEDFRKMFKVKADFDVNMDRSDEKIKKYTLFIKKLCDKEQLRHLKRESVSKIIEFGSRLSEDKGKLSARFMLIADMLRESSYWAGKEHSEYVEIEHVKKALKEKSYRSNLVEEKISELIKEDVLMVSVDGSQVGQINGLAVYDMGEYMFGKPSRITVRTFVGRAGIIDIERQVKMGGSSHSKGVMILNGFLGERFAQERPLSLNASVCFEQSYDGVDGDSATSSETYCLLSSLSGLPIRQDIAVTGSMNQHGNIQPVGGINQKIEGFYHTCKIKGLTGKQGVLIPSRNERNLMLDDEVVKAVKKGKFHIWSVETIDEGIELLTGKKAGVRGKTGKYPNGSVNYLVENKLKDYSKKSSGTEKSSKKNKKGK